MVGRVPLTADKKDDVSGFSSTAYWKPLVPMAEAVEEPNKKFNSQHAPSVPAEDAAFVPAVKHNFAKLFEWPVFTGTIKVRAWHKSNNKIKKNKGQIIYEKQFPECG
jgi:hypothetical protein